VNRVLHKSLILRLWNRTFVSSGLHVTRVGFNGTAFCKKETAYAEFISEAEIIF